MKMLIVDDCPTTRQLIRRVIAKWLGTAQVPQFLEACDGREGLAKVDQVDCIVTDRNMPEMCGIEFVRKVRESHPRLPILMVSACREAEAIHEAMRAGVDHYLTKPFPPAALVAILGALLSDSPFCKEGVICTPPDSRQYGFSDPLCNRRESGGDPGSGPENCASFRSDSHETGMSARPGDRHVPGAF